MKSNPFMVAALLAAASFPFLTGCGSTRLARPEITPVVRSAVSQRMLQPISPSRHTLTGDREKMVLDIDTKVNLAATGMCQIMFASDPYNCSWGVFGRTLHVQADNPEINAFVGDSYDLTILGGLVATAGSDDEIAMVLAHEYSHALLGHVAKSKSNSGLGVLAGLAVGIAAATAVGSDPQNAADIITGGVEVGSRYGGIAFSEGMELEADHLGLFIMQEAGYDISKSTDFLRRLMSLQAIREESGQKGMLGFLQTHPSDDDRIQNLLATEDMIRRGIFQPSRKR